jgi:hypothetical protein
MIMSPLCRATAATTARRSAAGVFSAGSRSRRDLVLILPCTRRTLCRSAQRLRPLLTYAYPLLAVQARIELTRVYLALASARTLIQEIDELLKLLSPHTIKSRMKSI